MKQPCADRAESPAGCADIPIKLEGDELQLMERELREGAWMMAC